MATFKRPSHVPGQPSLSPAQAIEKLRKLIESGTSTTARGVLTYDEFSEWVWKLKLAKELKSAFPWLDMNKAL